MWNSIVSIPDCCLFIYFSSRKSLPLGHIVASEDEISHQLQVQQNFNFKSGLLPCVGV